MSKFDPIIECIAGKTTLDNLGASQDIFLDAINNRSSREELETFLVIHMQRELQRIGVLRRHLLKTLDCADGRVYEVGGHREHCRPTRFVVNTSRRLKDKELRSQPNTWIRWYHQVFADLLIEDTTFFEKLDTTVGITKRTDIVGPVTPHHIMRILESVPKSVTRRSMLVSNDFWNEMMDDHRIRTRIEATHMTGDANNRLVGRMFGADIWIHHSGVAYGTLHVFGQPEITGVYEDLGMHIRLDSFQVQNTLDVVVSPYAVRIGKRTTR